MQKISLSSILVFLITASVSAHAFSSGPFYLTGGIVPFNDTKIRGVGILDIDLRLPWGATFNITCDIENPNYNKPNPVVIKIQSPGTIGSIDGVSSPSNQYLLNHNISKYQTQVKGDGGAGTKITFTNYDTTDSVEVKNCMAVYATS